MIKGVPNDACIDEQVIEVPYTTICSLTKQAFGGTIVVSLWPVNLCMEYCSVEEFVQGMRDTHQTHEQVCRTVFDAFMALTPRRLAVEVTADSAVHPTALCRISWDATLSLLNREPPKDVAAQYREAWQPEEKGGAQRLLGLTGPLADCPLVP